MIRNDRARLLRSSTRYMPFLGLRRPYELIRMPSTSTGFTHTQIVQKRPFLSAAFAAVRDAPLKALEKAANADPGNSMKQLNFLQALTDRYPAAAVRRFESPGYNYCENAFREYVRACELSGAEVKNFKPPAGVAAAGEAAAVNAAAGMRGVEGAQYAHATPQQYAQYGGLGGGGGGGAGSTNGTSSSRPLYVSLGEGGGWKTQAWKTGRILAVTFIFVTAFGAMLDSQGLGSRLPGSKDSSVQQSTSSDKRFKDVVGVDEAKNELEEIVDYLREPGKFTKLGGKLPRGVLLTGPPGTGKTLLAKAIAGEAGVPFFYCSGSGFEEVYVGVGARRVRDLFESAKKKSPCIIFIDEIDAIATKRFDAQTGADREVQRILLELLNQMDGFDQSTNVKVIMATNRADTLDPALLRPGRLDRKIEFPNPDRRQKRMVFQAATSKMNLSDDLDLEDYVNRAEKISCADVASICAEAGLQAVRENRYVVLPRDFDKAYKKAVSNNDKEHLFYTL
mmetsp:Transcript_12960/g.23740  ORF Transcript_12960/g.23740 Transcript_12960/m.23740 type:complete len:507 (+) Transcript_12960:3-1523(+)